MMIMMIYILIGFNSYMFQWEKKRKFNLKKKIRFLDVFICHQMFCIKENWIKVIIYTTNHLWAKNDFVSFGFYYFVEKKFENIGSWSAEFKSNRIDACSFHIFIYHFKNNKQTTTLKKKRKEKWSKKKQKSTQLIQQQ